MKKKKSPMRFIKLKISIAEPTYFPIRIIRKIIYQLKVWILIIIFYQSLLSSNIPHKMFEFKRNGGIIEFTKNYFFSGHFEKTLLV